MSAAKYPYIVANGRMWGSHKEFIERECQQAANEGAPETAVYYDIDNKRWITIDEFDDSARKRRLVESAEKIMKGSE
jgi:hypothetical protein